MASLSSYATSCSKAASQALVLCLCLVPLCSCVQHHSISWTPEGVRQYNTSNPLQVKLGDFVTFFCAQSGHYSYSNLWIQYREEQYNQCSCQVVPGDSCDPNAARNGYCAVDSGNTELIVGITRNDGDLGSVINFRPGLMYYLASYADVLPTLVGALSEDSVGGQCLQGLRMSLSVAEEPVKPAPPRSTSQGTTPGTDISEPVPTPTAGGMSGGSPNTDTTGSETEMTTTTAPQLEFLKARKVLDWHIIVMVVFGALIVNLLVVIIASSVLVHRRRRRRRTISKVDLGTCEEKIPDSPTPLYPNQVFDDPLN